MVVVVLLPGRFTYSELTWVMFQKLLISATGSVATEQPLPRRATFGGSLGIRRKNSNSEVWRSHCKGGKEGDRRVSCVMYAIRSSSKAVGV